VGINKITTKNKAALLLSFRRINMNGKRIKWGNIIIFILIICAAVAAYFYKNPNTLNILPDLAGENQIKDLNKDTGDYNTDKAVETGRNEHQMPVQDGFTVGLDSWIGGTPALIALSRGYNNDYSLNLKLKYIPNDGDRLAALKDGKINATKMSLPAFIKLREKYPDAGVIVGITDFSRGADGIVARSDIKTLNDMEGKRVSYVSGGTGKFILNKFLRLTGLRYVDIVPAERKEMFGVVDDLKAGRADLIVSWSPDMNMVVKEMNAAKPNSVRVLITTKEVPNLIPTVLVVNRNTIKDNPDMVEAFLKTWFVSAKYIIEKPDKAGEKLSQLMSERPDDYGEVTKEDVNESLLSIKLMSLNDNFTFFGVDGKADSFTPIIKDTVQTWRKYGDMTSKDIDFRDIVTNAFIRKLKDIKDDELLLGHWTLL
jgi:NitT/TauT family transport system substrate-binding protein